MLEMVPSLIGAPSAKAGGVASHLRHCRRRGWPRSGPSAPEAPGEDRRAWQVGQRVSRKDSADLGTVVEANGKIKVTGRVTSATATGQPRTEAGLGTTHAVLD